MLFFSPPYTTTTTTTITSRGRSRRRRRSEMSSATSTRSASSDGESALKKRKVLAVACNSCRQRKIRCDGHRPACERCTEKGLTCVYRARENESGTGALKRENELLRTQLGYFKQPAQDGARAPSSDDSPLLKRPPLKTPLSTSSYALVGERPVQSYFVAGNSSLPSSQQESTYMICMTLIYAMITRSDNEAALVLAKLRTLTSWNQIVQELSDTSGAVASFAKRAGTTIALSDRNHGQERRDSTGALYTTLSSTSWLPLAFERNIWNAEDRVDSAPLDLHQGHISIATAGLDDLSAGSFGAANAGKFTIPTTFKRRVNVPIWALMPLADSLFLEDPFEIIFQSLQAELDNGTVPEAICGAHAYVAALYDEKTYKSAPKLSQSAASIVNSVKLETTSSSLTAMGLMWLWWSFLRWTLIPSAQTFAELPDILHPQPSQVFVRHPFVVDLVPSPEMRNRLCTAGKFDLSWMAQFYKTMLCEWTPNLAKAIQPNPSTGEMDLTKEAKDYVCNLEVWSFGPSAKVDFPDLDRFFKIRNSDSLV